jgi:hypothetical protein
MISKKVKLLVEKVFEKSKSVNPIVGRGTDQKFIVEGTGGVVKMKFDSIEVQNLRPYDLIINESGQIFNVDSVEMNEDNCVITVTDKNNNELTESYSANTMFGFVDSINTFDKNEFGDSIEIYEDSKKKVKLNKIMQGDVKKYKVYVKNDKGNVVKVNFGDPNMEIKRDNPARRKNFRARHNCENPGPRWKARYWACKTWSSQSVTSMLKEETTNDKLGIVYEEIISNTVNSLQNLDYNPNLWGHLNDSK